jgi:TadE-like protein
VESAIVLSLLLLVLIGIIEFSLLMTSRANMKSAVNAAVRAGSIASNSPDSDYLILKEITSHLSGGVELVDYVIVFDATTAVDSQPPPACVAAAKGGGTGVSVTASGTQCNIYAKSVLAAPVEASFGYDAVTNPTATSDKFWPAKRRSATYSGGRDLLGVYIASKSKSVTGLVPRFDMQTVSILRIEAQDV